MTKDNFLLPPIFSAEKPLNIHDEKQFTSIPVNDNKMNKSMPQIKHDIFLDVLEHFIVPGYNNNSEI